MSVSPMLEYFCSRLEGLSVGHFRLEVQNQSSAITPQSIIRVTLPSNALVEIPSLAWHFNMKSTGASTGTATSRLPNGIDQVLNRVEVSIGGVSVAAGANFYSVLSKAKDIVDGAELDAGMNHPEIITTGANNNYVDGTAIATGDEEPVSTNNSAQFCINKFKGFLSSVQPPILSTDLMGDIVVTLFLDQANNVVTISDNITAAGFIASATADSPSYEINNMYFTIKAFSMANGVLDQLYAEQMASNEHLEVGFLQYFAFRDNNAGATRFNVATQSLNRIIVAHQANVNPIGANRHPVLAAGYNAIGSNAADRVLDLGKTKYIHPYTQFSEPGTTSKNLYEWQLNGAKYPMFRATAEDLLLITRQSGIRGHVSNDTMGLHQYLRDNFVSCMKLTLDAPNARYIQGLDVRGTSLNGYYNIYNNTNAPGSGVTIFLECGSSLFISPGRQVAVVQ